MSKLMEALKAGATVAAAKEASLQDASIEYEKIQQQLGDVYFSGAMDKARAAGQPIVIKMIEKAPASNLIPWIIASIAFLITALSLFSTKRVFIDVKVVDEKSAYARERFAEEPRRDLYARPAAAIEAEETVLDNLSAERISLRTAVFEGAGKLNSSAQRSELTLVNSSVAPFARASVRPAAPLDLTGSKIVFYAKGAKGGENLAFAIKDKGNVLGFDKGKLYPFPSGLPSDWQRVEIDLDKAAVDGFNKRGVVSMRFEFGSNVSNRPGDTVFIKDLQIL